MEGEEHSIRCIEDRRHILIAVDEGENSERAVLYAADFLKNLSDIDITLFSIVPLPDEDFFKSDDHRKEWIDKKSQIAKKILNDYQTILLHSQIPAERIYIKLLVKKSKSIADAIINETKELGYCTIVVGRRHLSRKEEFLFGSTSNELLHNLPQNICLWIIE